MVRCPIIVIISDIDECSTLDPCHHICNNTVGDFLCSCNEGFDLVTDKRNCERELTCYDVFLALLRVLSAQKFKSHTQERGYQVHVFSVCQSSNLFLTLTFTYIASINVHLFCYKLRY